MLFKKWQISSVDLLEFVFPSSRLGPFVVGLLQGEGERRTTMSASLGLDDVMEKARICGLAGLLAERAAVRSTKGAILLAMMGSVLFNGRKI